jgi:hypothetical protein
MDALTDLNDAFGKTGPYSVSLGADTKIRFCLAKKDPDGGITNGITRTVSFFGNDLNKSIEDTRLKNLISWDPEHYINIWYVRNIYDENFVFFHMQPVAENWNGRLCHHAGKAGRFNRWNCG